MSEVWTRKFGTELTMACALRQLVGVYEEAELTELFDGERWRNVLTFLDGGLDDVARRFVNAVLGPPKEAHLLWDFLLPQAKELISEACLAMGMLAFLAGCETEKAAQLGKELGL